MCEYRIESVPLGTPKSQNRIRHVRNRVGALLDGREGHPGSKVVLVGVVGMTLMMGHERAASSFAKKRRDWAVAMATSTSASINVRPRGACEAGYYARTIALVVGTRGGAPA